MDLRTYFEEHEVTQEQFAAEVGVTQGRVSQWLAGAKVPAERCIAIEEATDGKVTRCDLRPDLFGAPKKKAA